MTVASADHLPSCRHALLACWRTHVTLPHTHTTYTHSGENEYLMRCVMRLIGHLGPGIAPVAPICLQVGEGGGLSFHTHTDCTHTACMRCIWRVHHF